MASSSLTPKVALAKQDFLETKATNFKNYITGFIPSAKVLDFISKFEKDQLIPTIATNLIPIVTSKMTLVASNDLMKELQVPDEKKEEVQKKICAYLEMFVEVLLSK
jgi:hypothetical protein